MTVNIPAVIAPAPTMGPWIRYINKVITDLDNKVNPDAGVVGTTLKASSLTNYVKFADSNAINYGDVGPYIAVDQNPAQFPDVFPDRSGVCLMGAYRNNLSVPYTTPAIGVTSTVNTTLDSTQDLPSGVVYAVGDIFDLSAIVRAVIFNAVGTPTTASSTNVRIDPVSGVLQIVTSLQASKKDVFDLDPEMVMTLHPVTFVDANDKSENPRRMVGLIAEEVDSVKWGWEQQHPLASYDSEGTLRGVDYDRVGVAAVAMIQRQQREIDELKRQVEVLIATIGQ